MLVLVFGPPFDEVQFASAVLVWAEGLESCGRVEVRVARVPVDGGPLRVVVVSPLLAPFVCADDHVLVLAVRMAEVPA